MDSSEQLLLGVAVGLNLVAILGAVDLPSSFVGWLGGTQSFWAVAKLVVDKVSKA